MNTMDPRLYKAAATFGRVNLIKEDADLIKERADCIKEHTYLIKLRPYLIKKHADLIKQHADLVKKRTDLVKEVKEENPNLLLGVTPIGNTVFHLAGKVGDRDLVEEVYDEQCESLLAMTNSKGDTALHIAIRSRYLHIVNFLVEKSISASTSKDVEQGGNQTNFILGIQNHRNNTVLHEALRYCHEDVAKVLTENAPELWCVVDEAGESPLYLAAKGGLIEIVRQVVLESSHPYPHDITKLLVEEKPELIKEQDIYGRTALHYAVSYGRIDVVIHILGKDRSVAYIQDKDGRSPLHFAAGKGDTIITEVIIGRHRDAVDLVRDDEVLNQQDNDGNTPLHLAVISGRPDLVRLLLEKEGRVDTDTMNKDNFTPLHLAISREHAHASKQEIQVYKHLRDAGAKIGIVEPLNEKGWDFVNAQKNVEDKDKTSNIIKEINSNQMIVAALIATVNFAAAFQVPGGYNSNDGTAILAKKAAF
ncbi:hypothetical protein HHK36_022022 [Tetracentron sinense]|uniref:PGG domain-containing protein n=1 Tax=Tetracentron sinense TaxID=13715 RepID=A0A835D5T7_TETSI|nr:hypothetical protein HHK36_022022 [Tetracentron sinense]